MGLQSLGPGDEVVVRKSAAFHPSVCGDYFYHVIPLDDIRLADNKTFDE